MTFYSWRCPEKIPYVSIKSVIYLASAIVEDLQVLCILDTLSPKVVTCH